MITTQRGILFFAPPRGRDTAYHGIDGVFFRVCKSIVGRMVDLEEVSFFLIQAALDIHRRECNPGLVLV